MNIKDNQRNKQDIKLDQKNIRSLTDLQIRRFYSVKAQCQICLEDLFSDEIFRTNCGDTFHKSCIAENLKSNLQNLEKSLRCPSQGCQEKLSASLLPRLGFTKAQIKAFYNWQLEELIRLNAKEISSCPKAGCPNIFKLDPRSTGFVCELCDGKFCLKCKSELHPRFTCAEYQRSRNNEYNEEAFKDWAKNSGSKQCPKCCAWIQKTQGCNHMKCKCKHEFCYKCGKNYKNGKSDCKCPIFDDNSFRPN